MSLVSRAFLFFSAPAIVPEKLYKMFVAATHDAHLGSGADALADHQQRAIRQRIGGLATV